MTSRSRSRSSSLVGHALGDGTPSPSVLCCAHYALAKALAEPLGAAPSGNSSRSVSSIRSRTFWMTRSAT
ncbi:MAG: hypothetical protein M5U28_07660 [Sandaracinaceae bacterium]|nr:hypothetical protein [Sandaracinaceae bacterium]